jgi:hypothetical protein
MNLIAKIANIEQNKHINTDAKKGAPKLLLNSSYIRNVNRLLRALPIYGNVITTPNAKAKFFLLNKLDTSAA